MKLIDKYPKASFMIISKLYWCVGFFYTIFIIQDSIPTVRQWVLGAIFTVATLPLNYWLTYSFGGKHKLNTTEEK